MISKLSKTSFSSLVNKKQETKDYRGEYSNQFNKEHTIGIIKTARYDKNRKQVIGIVQIYKNKDYYKYFKPKYDNWQITFEDSKYNKFEFNAVELF